MVVGLERALLSSRLAALVSTVQSSRVLVEVILDIFAGRSCTSAVLTFIEGWMAACRLRLLTVQEPNCVMRSRDVAASIQDRWSRAFQRVRTGWRPSARLSAACSLSCTMQAKTVFAAPSPLALGEAIHIIRPVMHLSILRLTSNRTEDPGTGCGRLAPQQPWAPWLSALVLEALSFWLCSSGTLVGYPHGASNRAELRHRYGLLLQLLIRPALRALVLLLLRSVARRLPTVIMRPACVRTAELVASLDMVHPWLVPCGGPS